MILPHLNSKETIEPWRLHVLPDVRSRIVQILLNGYAKCLNGDPAFDVYSDRFIKKVEEDIWKKTTSVKDYRTELNKVFRIFIEHAKQLSNSDAASSFTLKIFHQEMEIRWLFPAPSHQLTRQGWQKNLSFEDRIFFRQSLLNKLIRFNSKTSPPLLPQALEQELSLCHLANRVEQSAWQKAANLDDYRLRLKSFQESYRLEHESLPDNESAARARPWTKDRKSRSAETPSQKRKKADNDSEDCLVCFEEMQAIRFLDCPHQPICEKCFLELGRNAPTRDKLSCPLCRGKVRILRWKNVEN